MSEALEIRAALIAIVIHRITGKYAFLVCSVNNLTHCAIRIDFLVIIHYSLPTGLGFTRSGVATRGMG